MKLERRLSEAGNLTKFVLTLQSKQLILRLSIQVDIPTDILSFADHCSPDMVGHTGDLKATVDCCSLVDQCVKVRLSMVCLSSLLRH